MTSQLYAASCGRLVYFVLSISIGTRLRTHARKHTHTHKHTRTHRTYSTRTMNTSTQGHTHARTHVRTHAHIQTHTLLVVEVQQCWTSVFCLMRLVLSDHNIYEYIDTSTSFRLVTTLCFIIVQIYIYIWWSRPSFITRLTGCWVGVVGGGGGRWGVFHSHDLSRGISTLNTVDSAYRLFTSPILVSMRKLTQDGGYNLPFCVVWRCW